MRYQRKQLSGLFITSIVVIILFIITGCGQQRVVTTWRTDHASPAKYRRVLVVAIVPEKDSLLRKKMETEFVNSLQEMGYQASSALSTFGAKGLSSSGEADTYLQLCEYGIDAVLTVALIHKTPQNYHQPGEAYVHPNQYYYNRIWSYKKLPEDSSASKDPNPQLFWESILFDLSTLEAACTVRTMPFEKADQPKIDETLSRNILRKMTREKIIKKQVTKSPKAF